MFWLGEANKLKQFVLGEQDIQDVVCFENTIAWNQEGENPRLFSKWAGTAAGGNDDAGLKVTRGR